MCNVYVLCVNITSDVIFMSYMLYVRHICLIYIYINVVIDAYIYVMTTHIRYEMSYTSYTTIMSYMFYNLLIHLGQRSTNISSTLRLES